MSSPKPVYLVSAWKGRVVTEHPSSEPSGVVMEHAGFKDAEQKWIAEFGEEPDTVALLSVSNKKYMTPTSKKYEHMAGTGEKIWWRISYDDVRIPGAFRLSVAGGRDDRVLAYVNMDGTSSMVMLEGWERNYTEHRTTWWFADPDGSPMSAKSMRAAADGEVASAKLGEENAVKQKALEEREAALAQKEHDVSEQEAAATRQKNESDAEKKALERREAALAQKEKDSAAEQKALEDREAALAQQEKNSSTNKKAFEDRAAAFGQKEKDYLANRKALEDREAAWEKQQKDRTAGDKSLNDRKAALAQQEKALRNREIALEEYEKDNAAGKKIFERRKAALAQREKEFAADKKALVDREAALADKENKRAAEWDKKMKELQVLREASAPLKKSDAGNQVGCGSKHYKPPRKINRKIIGIVYE